MLPGGSWWRGGVRAAARRRQSPFNGGEASSLRLTDASVERTVVKTEINPFSFLLYEIMIISDVCRGI